MPLIGADLKEFDFEGEETLISLQKERLLADAAVGGCLWVSIDCPTACVGRRPWIQVAEGAAA